MGQYPGEESSSVVHLVHESGKLIVPVQCKVNQQMIRLSGNLGRISKFEKVSFKWWRKEIMLLTCSGAEFQRVATATEEAPVPAWVLTLGTDNKWKPDERSSLGLGAW